MWKGKEGLERGIKFVVGREGGMGGACCLCGVEEDAYSCPYLGWLHLAVRSKAVQAGCCVLCAIVLGGLWSVFER